MEQNPFAPHFDDLPEELPIFPLRGALLLPCGELPLNIFQGRYLKMVEAALAGDRFIGMIQPKGPEEDGNDSSLSLYKTGCAGKITQFKETEDGRYLITLTGISRFDVIENIPDKKKPYICVRPEWAPYKNDLLEAECLDIDRNGLRFLLANYFKKEEMECDWNAVDEAPDGHLITCLSMICPFDPQEKQALLEAPCCCSRARLFMSILEMAVNTTERLESCH